MHTRFQEFLGFFGVRNYWIQHSAALSTVCYLRMGHGMGQRDSLKFPLNFLTQNIKEKKSSETIVVSELLWYEWR